MTGESVILWSILGFNCILRRILLWIEGACVSSVFYSKRTVLRRMFEAQSTLLTKCQFSTLKTRIMLAAPCVVFFLSLMLVMVCATDSKWRYFGRVCFHTIHIMNHWVWFAKHVIQFVKGVSRTLSMLWISRVSFQNVKKFQEPFLRWNWPMRDIWRFIR